MDRDDMKSTPDQVGLVDLLSHPIKVSLVQLQQQ